jgi:hypothetical protein
MIIWAPYEFDQSAPSGNGFAERANTIGQVFLIAWFNDCKLG